MSPEPVGIPTFIRLDDRTTLLDHLAEQEGLVVRKTVLEAIYIAWKVRVRMKRERRAGWSVLWGSREGCYLPGVEAQISQVTDQGGGSMLKV